MTILQKVFSWLGAKFDAWLSKVGEENRPERHDFDHIPEDFQLFSDSDRIADEKGEFNNT